MRDSSLSTIYLHFFFELFRSALFPSIVVVFFLTLCECSSTTSFRMWVAVCVVVVVRSCARCRSGVWVCAALRACLLFVFLLGRVSPALFCCGVHTATSSRLPGIAAASSSVSFSSILLLLLLLLLTLLRLLPLLLLLLLLRLLYTTCHHRFHFHNHDFDFCYFSTAAGATATSTTATTTTTPLPLRPIPLLLLLVLLLLMLLPLPLPRSRPPRPQSLLLPLLLLLILLKLHCHSFNNGYTPDTTPITTTTTTTTTATLHFAGHDCSRCALCTACSSSSGRLCCGLLQFVLCVTCAKEAVVGTGRACGTSNGIACHACATNVGWPQGTRSDHCCSHLSLPLRLHACHACRLTHTGIVARRTRTTHGWVLLSRDGPCVNVVGPVDVVCVVGALSCCSWRYVRACDGGNGVLLNYFVRVRFPANWWCVGLGAVMLPSALFLLLLGLSWLGRLRSLCGRPRRWLRGGGGVLGLCTIVLVLPWSSCAGLSVCAVLPGWH